MITQKSITKINNHVDFSPTKLCGSVAFSAHTLHQRLYGSSINAETLRCLEKVNIFADRGCGIWLGSQPEMALLDLLFASFHLITGCSLLVRYLTSCSSFGPSAFQTLLSPLYRVSYRVN